MRICLRRREFIALIGGAAVWPVAADAQQREMPVIDILSLLSPGSTSERMAYFRQALAKAGYVVGQNVAIEVRSANYDSSLLPRLAAYLVRRQVAVIVTSGGPATFAAKAATYDDSDCFRDKRRSGELRPRHQPQPTRRQHDRSALLSTALVGKRLDLLRECLPTTRPRRTRWCMNCRSDGKTANQPL
jgi:putative ABC transport system substrate-binding protein